MSESKPKDKSTEVMVPEPSQMAHEAIAEHLRTGGSTFDPRSGKNLSGSRHHAVGIAPEHSEVRNRPSTPQEHDNFVMAHHEVFSKHMNSAVGTHHDPETGLHHIEIVGLTPSKNAAIEMAVHLGEGHIHNLSNDEKTHVPKGEFQPSHLSVDDRLRHLHSQSPKREPYSGTHFADKKLDVIEGARRGEKSTEKAPSANADSARIHLGTKTGMGLDAPAGFYSVKAGASAPHLIATKPHSHPVRGQFAFGSTEHPEFKQGYADGAAQAAMNGADPHVAHLLGLNSAEHALQDAGYDGYHSPAHPNIRFHFGDHVVTHPQDVEMKQVK